MRRGIAAAADVPIDVDRVTVVLHPQGDAQVGVGLDLVVDDAGRALGGEDQVEPEAAAALGDVDERGHEVGELDGEEGELVDDDAGAAADGSRRGSRRCSSSEVSAGLAQHPFAVAELGTQAAQDPSGEVLVEVGDQTPTVCGRSAQASNAEPPLKSTSTTLSSSGGSVGGEPDDEAAQQLALAGAGGAGDEPVRAVGDEVDGEGPCGR